jgi:hypothetical protein
MSCMAFALARQIGLVTGSLKGVVLFMSNYDDYLRSEHWQATRAAALRRAGYKCQLCCRKRDRELHVHHLTYERLWHEDEQDLVVLCSACHWFLHTQIWREAFEAVYGPATT